MIPRSPMGSATRRWRQAGSIAAAGLVAGLAFAPTAVASNGFVENVDVLVALHGPAGSGYFGWAVSELVDIDADGVTDIIVSDPYRAGGGAAYVFSGADGAPIYQWVSAGANYYGYSIADAGDADADGTHDILVGDLAGAIELRSGATGALLHRFTSAAGDNLGSAVATAGDVNNDGHADLLLGARGVDGPVGVNSGVVYVVSGATYQTLRTIRGEDAGGLFGSATDLARDLDGDGRPDWVIGARDSGPLNSGRAYAYSSATGRQLWRVNAPKSGKEFGSFFVAGLDDIDGDGTPDVYAADYADSANGGQSGQASVVSGADGSIIYRWSGARPKEGTGPGREAGDIDADGVQDLAVGSYLSSSGAKLAGRVDIFSGATGARIASITSTRIGENLGFDVVTLGDTNADGHPDLLVSAATGENVYVISGDLP
jgi:VCBS repeat protein/FG-GAP repeat protein